jgi:dienelactone hydrolase
MVRLGNGILFSTLLLLFSSLSFGEVLVPKPDGKYAVSLSVAKLVDENRNDIFDPSKGKRAIMISLMCPMTECKKTSPVNYMPPATAKFMGQLINFQFGIPLGTLESVKLQVCSEPDPSAIQKVHRFPVVIFSPGIISTRLNHNIMAQYLASEGYCVVTIDHPYDAALVEYPDKTIITSVVPPNFNASNDNQFLPEREKDVALVRRQLSDSKVVAKLLPGAKHGLNTTNAALYGHSYGGTTSILVLSKEKDIVGALNMDGSQYGDLSNICNPAFLFGTGKPFTHSSENDTTWGETWKHIEKWGREMVLDGTRHSAFTDSAFLIKLISYTPSENFKKAIEDAIGTLDGKRSFIIISECVKAFMKYAFYKKKDKLLDTPSRVYPELDLVRSR